MLETLYIIIAILVVLLVYAGISAYRLKKTVTNLTQEQFIEGYRKAQLIDVREPKEFDGGHILGARNIPSSQLRQRHKEIRPDKPVYLYCQNGARSGRAAMFLKKKGIRNLTSYKAALRAGPAKSNLNSIT